MGHDERMLKITHDMIFYIAESFTMDSVLRTERNQGNNADTNDVYQVYKEREWLNFAGWVTALAA